MTTIEVTDKMIDAGLYELDEVCNPAYTKQYRRACVHHAIKAALAAAPTPATEPPTTWHVATPAQSNREHVAMIHATEPVRGSADGAIEFKPQEGRRTENAAVADLQRQVTALTEQCNEYADVIQHVDQRLADHDAQFGKIFTGSTPDQPATDGIQMMRDALNTAFPLEDAAECWEEIGCEDAGDEAKWEKVASSAIEVGFDQVKSGAFSWHDFQAQLLPHKVNQVKAAVTKAVELSLVPRIDPDDLKQVRVVAEIIARDYGANDVMDCFGTSSDILTALAGLNGGER